MALEVTLLESDEWSKCRPLTIQCVTALKVSVYPIRAGGNHQNDELDDALKPLLAFCKALDEYTRSTMADGTITSSHAENFLSLQDHMTERIEEIITRNPDCLKDTSIKDLFSAFSNTSKLPDPAVDVFADKGYQQRQALLDEQEQLELQQAIAASLEDAKNKASAAVESAIDQRQREIQEAYLAAGGDLGEGQGDIPQDDVILSHVPESGITFYDLTRKLNVHHHERDILEGFSERVHGLATEQDGKLFPPQQASDLPSDQTVRETIWTHSAKVDMMDLLKILKVRQLPIDKQKVFMNGILKRGVVEQDVNGHLVVKRSSSATATQTPGDARRQSQGVGNPFVNMPTFQTPTGQTASHQSPAKFGSAEHNPAPTPEDPFIDTPQAAAVSLLSSKLPAEMLRIRAAVSAHLRNWKEGFPRPSQCKWNELKSEERTTITRHVVAYIQQHDLIDKRDTIDATVQHFLHEIHFPVKIGQNESAIQAAVKGVYSEDAKKKKKKEVAAAEEPEVAEEEESEVEGDTAPGKAPPARPATLTDRRNKRSRLSSSSASGASSGSPRARKTTGARQIQRKKAKVVGDEESD